MQLVLSSLRTDMQGRNKFLKDISSNIISSSYVLYTYDPDDRLHYNLVFTVPKNKQTKKTPQETTTKNPIPLSWIGLKN